MKRAYELTCIKYSIGLAYKRSYRITINGKTSYYTIYEALDSGYAKVMKNGKWGILTPEGNIWGRIEYTNIYSYFNEDMIRVEKNGKFGYADRATGRFIDCVFDEAEDFENGYALVRWRGVERIINTAGKFVY